MHKSPYTPKVLTNLRPPICAYAIRDFMMSHFSEIFHFLILVECYMGFLLDYSI